MVLSPSLVLSFSLGFIISFSIVFKKIIILRRDEEEEPDNV